MAGERSRSSASRLAAVPRKSGLAKLDHLPCQPTISAGRFGIARIRRHRATDERSLAQSDGLADHVVKDVVVAEIAHLLEHVAAKDRATVIERGKQPQDA